VDLQTTLAHPHVCSVETKIELSHLPSVFLYKNCVHIDHGSSASRTLEKQLKLRYVFRMSVQLKASCKYMMYSLSKSATSLAMRSLSVFTKPTVTHSMASLLLDFLKSLCSLSCASRLVNVKPKKNSIMKISCVFCQHGIYHLRFVLCLSWQHMRLDRRWFLRFSTSSKCSAAALMCLFLLGCNTLNRLLGRWMCALLLRSNGSTHVFSPYR
jgi:hypothetical protein